METTTIKQTETFAATPQKVYDLIIDEKKHAAFSGSPASMSGEVNGQFSVYDGYCTGHNLELIKGEKIVQAWHFAEDGWPDDHFSICTFLFEPEGNHTRLTFTQTGVPKHKAAALAEGWKEYYWDLMQAYLADR